MLLKIHNNYFFIFSFLSIFTKNTYTIITKSNPKSIFRPTWDSLDTRSIPDWYDQAKIGIFIHWGLWSVPAAGFNESAFLWYYLKQNQSDATEFINKYYKPNFQYPDLAPLFKAEFYSPEYWLDIFNSSGAKYIVYVAKHHDGYSHWDSNESWNWNSMTTGPHMNLVASLVDTIRKNSNLRIGLYYSLFEFYNDLYISDRESNFTKNDYIKLKMMPQLKDLVLKFKPDLLWSDGDWETDSNYWQSREFLAWLYNESPVSDTIVVNDRWGTDSLCKHGDYLTCTDRFNPHVLVNGRKWENAMTLDRYSWGYRNNYNLNDVLNIEELIEEIVTTISCGGNILINVGPKSDGTIDVIFEERLRQMGEWLNVNGEAIYNTSVWYSQNDTLNNNQVWYTSRLSDLTYKSSQVELYAISFKWPTDLDSYDSYKGTISLNTSLVCDKINSLNLLGYSKNLTYDCSSDDLYKIFIHVNNLNEMNVKSKWAWVFKIKLIV